MKEKSKSVILLFLICLVLIPSFIYGASTRTTQLQVAAANKVLTSISVSPKEVKLPMNADEAMLKEKLKVEANFKQEKKPTLITDYETNFDSLKTKQGSKKVTISYTVDGCTKKAKVCVEFIEPNESQESEDMNFPYISGYPDKTFRPDQAVTREELATMLARLISKNQIPAEQNQFTDLQEGRFSTDAINYITKLGIMRPVTKEQFDPMGKVSDAEFRQIIERADKYIKDKNVTLPEGNNDLTRAEAVVALNKLFRVKCNTTHQTSPFTDVRPSDKDYAAILCATQERNTR